jgi:uncharacterized metal-binding protein YceD (DUF177 family)
LCQTCGKNLNDGPCGHSAGDIDERWTTLKALLDKK